MKPCTQVIARVKQGELDIYNGTSKSTRTDTMYSEQDHLESLSLEPRLDLTQRLFLHLKTNYICKYRTNKSVIFLTEAKQRLDKTSRDYTEGNDTDTDSETGLPDRTMAPRLQRPFRGGGDIVDDLRMTTLSMASWMVHLLEMAARKTRRASSRMSSGRSDSTSGSSGSTCDMRRSLTLELSGDPGVGGVLDTSRVMVMMMVMMMMMMMMVMMMM